VASSCGIAIWSEMATTLWISRLHVPKKGWSAGSEYDTSTSRALPSTLCLLSVFPLHNLVASVFNMLFSHLHINKFPVIWKAMVHYLHDRKLCIKLKKNFTSRATSFLVNIIHWCS
jgi:hypothetical protein